MFDPQDAINGGLELVSSVLILMHIRRTILDGGVLGISVPAQGAYTLWGAWNCYFYPHLGQWLSFAGGILVLGTNLTWTVILLRYRTP